jgi:hypothetical protein
MMSTGCGTAVTVLNADNSISSSYFVLSVSLLRWVVLVGREASASAQALVYAVVGDYPLAVLHVATLGLVICGWLSQDTPGQDESGGHSELLNQAADFSSFHSSPAPVFCLLQYTFSMLPPSPWPCSSASRTWLSTYCNSRSAPSVFLVSSSILSDSVLVRLTNYRRRSIDRLISTSQDRHGAEEKRPRSPLEAGSFDRNKTVPLTP